MNRRAALLEIRDRGDSSAMTEPFAVIAAILVGAALAGIAGDIFLAVPIVAVASVVFKHWLEGDRRVTEATSGEAVPVPRMFPNAQTPAIERAML